ncbi:dual specificity protein phosphatase family protein [Paenibacillus profundus]|uniref:Dual specificity protein phosphatase family protein n=1 Tax=Paenibacillus profundus TaxID=1173085 RepID=A0ABS8YN71_9BACL|nr:dual specificity protein phosphatase family protein [Paenibacillus profundus]MCE5173266.1 dual specificity protein phosphatase family protein [Paenibacillus profundus]
MNEKPYHALIPNLYMCGAKDVNQLIQEQGIDVVVDLRAEVDPAELTPLNITRIHAPLEDHAEDTEESQMKEAIQAVVTHHQAGKKVAFHCGAGRGRTGAVAVGTLLELKLASDIDEALSKAREARSILKMNEAQRATLMRIYP